MSISSTVVRFADIRFEPAADVLAPFVGCFWVITAQRHASVRVVPDGSTAISIELMDGCPPAWSLRGPLLGPDERRIPPLATIVGVRLRPGVAFILTGRPTDSLVNRRIGLDTLPSCRVLACADARPDTPAECIAALERFLIGKLENARVHEAVTAALEAIESAQGCVRVSTVARRAGISPRHLHRLMRVWVGYGTKRAASIARFQAALHRIEQTPGAPAAALASDNGYFDQSHLSADVARFAGSTPGRLSSRWADFSKTLCDR